MFINPMTATTFSTLSREISFYNNISTTISTFAPRTESVVFGYQWAIQKCFIEYFADFFAAEFSTIEDDFLKNASTDADVQPIIEAFRRLHDFGYLPIAVWAIPEGYIVPANCPTTLIFNTMRGFSWLPPYLETLWLQHTHLPSAIATSSYKRRKAAEPYFKQNPKAIIKLCADFSISDSPENAAIGGLAHLLSFGRTANISTNALAAEYYLSESPLTSSSIIFDNEAVSAGISHFAALLKEQKLPEQYNKLAEVGYNQYWETELIAELLLLDTLLKLHPRGSIVYAADSYDLWGVIGKVIPTLRDQISSRKGKLIIQISDSDPIPSILGYKSPNKWTGLGLVASLDAVFGHTTNNENLNILDQHVSLICSGAITLDDQNLILNILKQNHFAAENICLSTTAPTQTILPRATTTYIDKSGVPIVARPRFQTVESWRFTSLAEALESKGQLLRSIFHDGEPQNIESFNTIRERLWSKI